MSGFLIPQKIHRGFLGGLILSNNVADATNDIDISAGISVDSTNVAYMKTAAFTKQLDAAWAAGSAAGGRDTGSIANAWWFPWQVATIGNTVDFLLSQSATAPTLPVGYAYGRRIGAFLRTGGAIKPFTQTGDEFLWTDPVTEIDTVHPGTSAVTVTLAGVPTGIVCDARIRVTLKDATANNNVLLSSLSQTDSAPTATSSPLSSVQSSTTTRGRTEFYIRTNTSAQIRYRCGNSTAGDTTVSIVTVGWRETRGRDV